VAAQMNMIAPSDAPVVRNLKKAGAIVVGLTNTPEFSFRGFTENPLHGLTLNPWDPDITCGGSSGSAARIYLSRRGDRHVEDDSRTRLQAARRQLCREDRRDDEQPLSGLDVFPPVVRFPESQHLAHLPVR
jgi:hypothetical protein